MGDQYPNLKSWPKGISGNPAGPRPLPPEVRAERKRNQAALIQLVGKMLAANKSTRGKTELERAIAGMIKASKDGDVRAFSYLIEIICGKLPEHDPETMADQLTPEQKLALLEKAAGELRAQITGRSDKGSDPGSD